MIKHWTYLMVFAALVMGRSTALANGVYIAQTAVGAANGADCANALGVTYFNTSGNWASGTPNGTQIGPGTTVHLCGTFTGTAGSTMLTVQGSGSSGNPITVLFESGASLTAPYWNGSSGAINTNGKTDVVIDGGTGGVIQATANGTNLTYKQASLGIQAVNCTRCTVKNLTIANMYVHVPNDTILQINEAAAIKYIPANNFTVDHCTVHDGLWLLDGWGTNLTITNNEIYHMDHGIAIGPSGQATNITIAGNHFHDWVNWDTGAANAYHHDGIHMWGGIYSGSSASDSVSGAYIYNNIFDGDTGSCCTTALIYVMEQMMNVNIYNNRLIVQSNRTTMPIRFEGASESGDTYHSGHGYQNAVYNNYISSGSLTGSQAGIYSQYQDNLSVMNNVFRAGQSDIALFDNTALAPNSLDYNLYENNSTGDTFDWSGNIYTTLLSWQNALPAGSGADAHSRLLSPSAMLVDSGGHPQSGSPAVGAGTNLTSLCTALTGLCSDAAGVARPGSGPWDVGAYKYVSAAPPAPPTGLTATPH
jgi:hypothetical protein